MNDISTLNQLTLNQLARNILLERARYMRDWMDPRRDIDRECGYPTEDPAAKELYRLYKRGDVAARVVDIWPEESWTERPQVYETEDPEETTFEKAWIELEQQFSLFPVLQRADILSGIGRYGVILLGLDDGKPLNEEAAPGAKLTYIRCFEESVLTITNLETDPTNPRYGLPVAYQVGFQETALEVQVTTNLPVHHSRVIHLADNRTNSDVFGTPRMMRVLNRLLDLRKTAGGSGEMFWRGGFPGLSLEALPEILTQGAVEIDLEATKEQLENYMNGLQRYLATSGMTAKSLPVEVADPLPHIDIQLKLIASALGVPWRVFVGSEQAQLASEMDIRTWNRRVSRRRTEYLTPYVILPLLHRFIELGILPATKSIHVAWPDLNTPSDRDKAAVGESRTNALAKYVAAGVNDLIPPFHYLTLVLGMTEKEAKSIVDASTLELAKTIQEEGGAVPPE